MSENGSRWDMVDHPEIDRTFRPSRVENLVSSTSAREALERGEGVEVGEDALSRLKVFDEESNQLGIKDVEKLQVACIECSEPGIFSTAEMVIPNFGMSILQSFSCSNSNCGMSYRKVRVVNPDRGDNTVEKLEEGMMRRVTLLVKSERDLAREVIISDDAIVKAGELELSFRDGSMSTVEGALRQAVSKLRFMHIISNDDESGEALDVGKHLSGMVDALIDGVHQGVSFQFVIEDEQDASHVQTFPDDDQVSFDAVPVEDQGDVEESMARLHLEECNDPSCEGCGGESEETGSQGREAGEAGTQEAVQDLTEYLNRFAEHVQVQEGLVKSELQKQMQNKEEDIRTAQQFLDQMD